MTKRVLTPEERVQRLEEAHNRLTEAVESLITGNDWAKYLATMAKFHAYSWRNSLLIAWQRPLATRVAGFQTWKSLGRRVVKGSKGIAILAPSTIKVEDKETGDEAHKIIGFRTVHVFDVATTDGEPLTELPGFAKLTGNAPLLMIEAVCDQITERGFKIEDVERIPGSPGALGCTHFAQKLVQLVQTLYPAQQAKTLAHELAHITLEHDKMLGVKDRALLEVEAESVAYLLADAFGLDSTGYTLGYVANWSGGNPTVVMATAETVQKTAKSLLEAMDMTEAELVTAALS